MEPTLLGPKNGQNDTVLVDLTAYNHSSPKRNDIVAYTHPTTGKKHCVKRTVAIPGDILFFSSTGIFVNDKLISPRPQNKMKHFVLFKNYTLPPNKYFLLGDNFNFSLDSTEYGFINGNLIFGRVENIFYPLNRINQTLLKPSI